MEKQSLEADSYFMMIRMDKMIAQNLYFIRVFGSFSMIEGSRDDVAVAASLARKIELFRAIFY